MGFYQRAGFTVPAHFKAQERLMQILAQQPKQHADEQMQLHSSQQQPQKLTHAPVMSFTDNHHAFVGSHAPDHLPGAVLADDAHNQNASQQPTISMLGLPDFALGDPDAVSRFDLSSLFHFKVCPNLFDLMSLSCSFLHFELSFFNSFSRVCCWSLSGSPSFNFRCVSLQFSFSSPLIYCLHVQVSVFCTSNSFCCSFCQFCFVSVTLVLRQGSHTRFILFPCLLKCASFIS